MFWDFNSVSFGCMATSKNQNSIVEEAKRRLDQWEDLEREICILKEENANLRRLLSGSPAIKLSQRVPTPGRVLSPSQHMLSARTPSPSTKHSHVSPYPASRGSYPSTPQGGAGDAGTPLSV
ncbi:uncharacterized protein LOC144437376 [Glandiceps talaboti]